MSKRKKIDAELEARLLVESRNTCNICWKNKEVEIHHIIPVSLGGDNSEDNLIVVCRNCHSVAHTKKEMARNLGPKTLQLYKETWLDLIKRHPSHVPDIITYENDVDAIRDIIKQAHRRALYFPFHYETPQEMFHSLDQFRIYIQRSGYKLIRNEEAREHITGIHRALLEIPSYSERDWHDARCIHGFLGREQIKQLDIKRKTACFHINVLGRLIGCDYDIIGDDEFEKIGFEIERRPFCNSRCYGQYDEQSEECMQCEFRTECLETTLSEIH